MYPIYSKHLNFIYSDVLSESLFLQGKEFAKSDKTFKL